MSHSTLPPSLPAQLSARDGLKLHLSHWPLPSSPEREAKGVVVLLHGLSEHGRRYKEVATLLNEWGWAVVAPDARGHGMNEGTRCGLRQDDDLLHDLATVIDGVRLAYPGMPLVLMGHSMGGALAARLAAAQALPRDEVIWARPIEGLVLSSPALQPSMSLVQKALLSTMGRLIQDVPVPIAFKPEWVNPDPAVIEEFHNDPLAHGKITPRMALFLSAQGPIVARRAAAWTVPTLLLYTPHDRLVMREGCEGFAQAVPHELMTLRAFPGLAHDLLRIPERERVLSDLQQWLCATFPSAMTSAASAAQASATHR